MSFIQTYSLCFGKHLQGLLSFSFLNNLNENCLLCKSRSTVSAIWDFHLTWKNAQWLILYIIPAECLAQPQYTQNMTDTLWYRVSGWQQQRVHSSLIWVFASLSSDVTHHQYWLLGWPPEIMNARKLISATGYWYLEETKNFLPLD